MPPPYDLRSARRSHVLVDVLRQHVEGNVAAANQRIVERLQIELRAKRRTSLLALPVYLGVAHFVATGLPGPRAVAIDFARYLEWIRSIHLHEVPHSLLARPPLCM